MVVGLGFAVFALLLLLGRGAALARLGQLRRALPPPIGGHSTRLRDSARSENTAGIRLPVLSVAIGAAGGALGFRLLGPVGVTLGASAAFMPMLLDRRRRKRRSEEMEGQLIELVEAVAQCVRSGLSLGQALAFAEGDLGDPMASVLHRVLAATRVGTPLEHALSLLAEDVGSDDARMFVLVLGIHLRSGGDVGEALDQLAATIRRRVGVRRELRALTAQGRISGTVLVALPVGFLLFLSITSGRDLLPVYRSAAGMTMLCAGLVLDGFALLWIRRLLRVDL